MLCQIVPITLVGQVQRGLLKSELELEAGCKRLSSAKAFRQSLSKGASSSIKRLTSAQRTPAT